MRRLVRDERGMAMITAVLLLSIMMALGLGITRLASGQQQGARTERVRDSAYNQAEAVLNAQIYQLARSWPASSGTQATASCTPTTVGAGTTATTCPDPQSLTDAFTTDDYTVAAAGCTAPVWKTVVQDDDAASGGTQYYDPTVMDAAETGGVPARPSYDANGNNAVWVRATAQPRCTPHKQVVVALATRGRKPLNWPASVVASDWFQTSNSGSKVIINTIGSQAQAAGVSVRCVTRTGSACRNYKAGQVAPDTTNAPAVSNPTINGMALNDLRTQAQTTGVYSAGCTSPSISGLAFGTVVFIEGGSGCTVSVSGNSSSNPVILIIKYGAFSISGNAKFYGLVYAANSPPTGFSARTDALVTLGGCAKIIGLVSVDGGGGVNVGSCKGNLTYDPSVLTALQTFDSAVAAKNSFRVLQGAG